MSKFNKFSEQRGTLLVEAIAMLGLIALVTPTLYKKSAERLQEIQDINTASQARTMNSIIETFMKTHFPLLMDATSTEAQRTVEIAYDDNTGGYFEKGYSAFVPFGYIPGELKNYGTPKIYIHRDNDSLISYILYPTINDPGKKRAARLASLVGANGGTVSKPMGSSGSSHIYGTGGAWELDPDMVQELGVEQSSMIENSLVVTSPEPISMSNADSEKFLYRVPPDGDGKDYHNTMVTNLFLGGHKENTNWQNDAKDYYSIFNVRKLTLNTNCNRKHIDSTTVNYGSEDDYCDPNVADLYVGKPFIDTQGFGTAKSLKNVNGNNGSAWFYGNLAAVNENFRLFYTGDDYLNERSNGYDVLEFSRKGDHLGTDTVDLSILRAENASGSARVSMMSDFVQVKEDGIGGEFLVGSSSFASTGGLIHAYKLGGGNILRLNSPENLEGDSEPSQFITHISRRGGTVYINGGSSTSDKMDTYINDMGGVLSAGSSGSWFYAANNGASSRVDILNGADGFGTATSDNRIFTVGDSNETSDANMLYGTANRTSLRNGRIQVFNALPAESSYVASRFGGATLLANYMDAYEGPTTTMKGATAIMTTFTDILGSTYLGISDMREAVPEDGLYSRGNWRLGVAGSAWIDETLWARRAWLKEGGMQELHAGFSSYSDWLDNPKKGWLNVYDDRISIRNRREVTENSEADNSLDTMFYADLTKVIMRDLQGAWGELTQGSARFGSENNYIFADSSAADSSAINVVGSSFVNIYTAADHSNKYVNIQKDALKLAGHPGEDSSYANTIEARAGEFSIQTYGQASGSEAVQFYANSNDIRTRYVDFTVENKDSSAIFKVKPDSENDAEMNAQVQVHGTLNVEGNPVIHIGSNDENRANSDLGRNAHAMMEIEPSYVQIWAREQSGTDSSWGSYARAGETGGYYAMLKVNPSDISGGSSSVDDTDNASVYIRRGAIELETSSPSGTDGSDFAADQGFGYIKGNRFVSNAGKDVPTYATGGQDATSAPYDQYMVNPAYTSVMHDIKLTTRGGARLSDVLPDYVLKGVYNLINDRKESSINSKDSSMGSWAHPFIGVVPFASCPPGYRNMATVVPISFNMGQAGDLIKASEMGKDGLKSDRWVVNPFSRQVRIVQDGKDVAYPGLNQFSSWVFNSVGGDFTNEEFAPVTKSRIEGWYWGFDATHPDNTGSTTTSNVNTEAGGGGSGRDYIPWQYLEDASSDEKVVAEALYFQQNTWLKTSLDPQERGWNAYMGFLYDVEQWYTKLGIHQDEAPVRSNYNDGTGNETSTESLTGEYVWNFFPIPTNTLEGHATVYCYFDRKQFKDGNWSGMVDQIDQLGALDNTSDATFRELYKKPASDYTRRLNDPSLKYNDPW